MKVLTAVATTLLLCSGMAMAAPPAGSAAPAGDMGQHHSGMKHCQKEATAKGLKGDERTKFVKDCKASAHSAK